MFRIQQNRADFYRVCREGEAVYTHQSDDRCNDESDDLFHTKFLQKDVLKFVVTLFRHIQTNAKILN